jgi:hypothetical protein
MTVAPRNTLMSDASRPALHGLRPDVLHDLLHAGLALAVHEHALGVRGGKARAARGGAGLVEHRRALARRLAQVHGVHLVLRAAVVHHVHLGRIDVDAVFLVAQHGAVFPAAFPELVDQRHVFVGQVVAVVVRGLAREAHGARGAVEVAGDDVPADAPAGQVVQRGHAPREEEGRLVGEVGRHAEAQVPGGRGHGRDQQRGVVHGHLHGAAQGGIGVAAEHVVHAHHVGEEHAVEKAGLQPGGVVGPVVDVEVARRLVARVRPQALLYVADAVHVEGIQADLTAHVGCLLVGCPAPVNAPDHVSMSIIVDGRLL